MLSNRDGGWGRVQYEVGYTVGCRTGNLSLNMFKFKQQKHDISFWWCKKWGETTPADLNKSLVWGSIYSNSKIITLLTSDIDCKQLRFDAVSAHVAWWIFQEGRRFFTKACFFRLPRKKADASWNLHHQDLTSLNLRSFLFFTGFKSVFFMSLPLITSKRPCDNICFGFPVAVGLRNKSSGNMKAVTNHSLVMSQCLGLHP